MTKLDRYLLFEWLKAFVMALGVTVGVLLLFSIQDDLPDFTRYKSSLLEALSYFLWLIPSFLPLVIPVAFLISLLFTLGNLHRNGEIIAMRALGLSLLRITRSLWLMAALLAGTLFYLNAELVPLSFERAQDIHERARYRAEARVVSPEDVGLVYNPVFNNFKDRRKWVINRYSRRTQQAFGVNVYELDGQGREVTRVMAAEAVYFPEDGYWVMLEGVQLNFDVETGDPYFRLPFTEKPYENYTESPELMLALNREPKDLSLNELKSVLEKVPPEENPALYAYAVRLQSIMASPFSCLVVAGIAIPFAVAGVRTNPIIAVSKSSGLFAAYYFLASLYAMLGSQNIVSPTLAAWAPILMLAVLTGAIMRRSQ